MNTPLFQNLLFALTVACVFAMPVFSAPLTQVLLGAVALAALAANTLVALLPKANRPSAPSSSALEEVRSVAQKALQSASQTQNQFNDFVTRTGLDAINKY